MGELLHPINKRVQQQRIIDLISKYPSSNKPRDDIRDFVRLCVATYSIKEPVLDIGSGYRSNEPEICSQGLIDFYTVDNNASYLPDFVCDASNLHFFEDEIFGCVICTEMLEHVEQPVKAIEEIHRVLKTGGLLIVTVPFWVPIHENSAQNDYWRFTSKGIRLLLASFEIISIETSGEESKPIGIFVVAVKP